MKRKIVLLVLALCLMISVVPVNAAVYNYATNPCFWHYVYLNGGSSFYINGTSSIANGSQTLYKGSTCQVLYSIESTILLSSRYNEE